jgi:hypothetical protein
MRGDNGLRLRRGIPLGAKSGGFARAKTQPAIRDVLRMIEEVVEPAVIERTVELSAITKAKVMLEMAKIGFANMEDYMRAAGENGEAAPRRLPAPKLVPMMPPLQDDRLLARARMPSATRRQSAAALCSRMRACSATIDHECLRPASFPLHRVTQVRTQRTSVGSCLADSARQRAS